MGTPFRALDTEASEWKTWFTRYWYGIPWLSLNCLLTVLVLRTMRIRRYTRFAAATLPASRIRLLMAHNESDEASVGNSMTSRGAFTSSSPDACCGFQNAFA